MELIETYDYCNLIESWYKETYNKDFDPYETDTYDARKFEISMGFTFEGTTVDNEYIRLYITDKSRFFLNQIKYGFLTFSEEIYCEE